MSKTVTITTADNVDLQFKVAGPGSRIAAGLIDLSIIWGIVGLICAVLAATGGISISIAELSTGKLPAQFQQFSLVVLLGSIFGLNIGYFIFFEKIWNGQSIGKRAIGLRVTNDNGQTLSLSASIVRNLARIVDILPGPYVIGFISVLVSKNGQRVGDLIAGTVVMNTQNVVMPQKPFPQETYSGLSNPQFRFQRSELEKIGSSGFRILDGYFHRVPKLQEAEQTQLEEQLAQQLSQALLDPEVQIDNPHTFLKELYLSLREHLNS